MRILSHNVWRVAVLLALGSALSTHPAIAQSTSSDPSFPTADHVVQRIYQVGMQHSQAATLAQVLMDSIGPRLTGSPANRAAND
jgi:carboxypeptidase Q